MAVSCPSLVLIFHGLARCLFLEDCNLRRACFLKHSVDPPGNSYDSMCFSCLHACNSTFFRRSVCMAVVWTVSTPFTKLQNPNMLIPGPQNASTQSCNLMNPTSQILNPIGLQAPISKRRHASKAVILLETPLSPSCVGTVFSPTRLCSQTFPSLYVPLGLGP